MSDHGILFSAPMVTSIWKDRKTQTRRLANPRWGVGDLLWVREAFSGPHGIKGSPSEWPTDSPIWYWADGNPADGDWTKPKPSIHMPRFASRLTLLVTGIRQEPLLSISRKDARAEGLSLLVPVYGVPGVPGSWCRDPRRAYWGLWDHLHGKGSSAANPDVWVTEFEVFRTKIDRAKELMADAA